MLGEVIETILGTAILAGYILWLYRRNDTLSGQLVEAQATAADMYQEALVANQLRTKAETELTFLQQTVMGIMNKPIMATMSEMQMQNITGAIIQYVESIRKPELMN